MSVTVRDDEPSSEVVMRHAPGSGCPDVRSLLRNPGGGCAVLRAVPAEAGRAAGRPHGTRCCRNTASRSSRWGQGLHSSSPSSWWQPVPSWGRAGRPDGGAAARAVHALPVAGVGDLVLGQGGSRVPWRPCRRRPGGGLARLLPCRPGHRGLVGTQPCVEVARVAAAPDERLDDSHFGTPCPDAAECGRRLRPGVRAEAVFCSSVCGPGSGAFAADAVAGGGFAAG